MKVGYKVKWNKAMATIISIDRDRLYIHLDCNVVKWVSVSEVETYKKE